MPIRDLQFLGTTVELQRRTANEIRMFEISKLIFNKHYQMNYHRFLTFQSVKYHR